MIGEELWIALDMSQAKYTQLYLFDDMEKDTERLAGQLSQHRLDF